MKGMTVSFECDSFENYEMLMYLFELLEAKWPPDKHTSHYPPKDGFSYHCPTNWEKWVECVEFLIECLVQQEPENKLRRSYEDKILYDFWISLKQAPIDWRGGGRSEERDL